uniref:Helicase ATP-binding domain-containing protein n=1 Tax=Odontella aurita TaxID=265563 RepID=A0A7S4ITI2_9STRA|mmetsp:Transcript_30104/g.89560  ORF Transcript_30104/g.89560 Transcript_30104/m.89560 type:complete len:978 (+) Transcript_30104:278-3211(+)
MDPVIDVDAPNGRAVLTPVSSSATNMAPPVSTVTGVPVKPAGSSSVPQQPPSNASAAYNEAYVMAQRIANQGQYRAPVDLTGGAAVRNYGHYAAAAQAQQQAAAANLAPTYAGTYQSSRYNPVPRKQHSNAISIPQPISQPVQNYPGTQSYPRYNGGGGEGGGGQYAATNSSSYPVAMTQYAAAHNLPPPVGRIKFSLISPQDFTVLSSKYRYGEVATDDEFMKGFESDIKRLSKKSGGGGKKSDGTTGATFEQAGKEDDDEELLGTARWRIPLKSYDDIFAFFDGRDDVVVEGIPPEHLKAANLHLRHLEEGYPEPKALVEKGIPPHLASTLTGYQRGGVNFVLSKNGRALIADEMGLGKTLQSIASMCAYVDEGRLLVLCPSSVRFNWKAEMVQWLGKETTRKGGQEREHPALIDEKEVQVFQTGKDVIKKHSKVVIASYDLFANMVKKGSITESTFQRIIVDESHMLKNIKAQRTKVALPILKAAKRCVLLSGTPAFKNPSELYPQLHILGGGKWWENEKDFKEKYCYKSSSVGGRNNLELFSLMSSTVMIRRKKSDVLKEVLPGKNRELAHVAVTDPSDRRRLDGYMERLRDTQGSLGVVARGIEAKKGNNRSSSKSGASASADLRVNMDEEDVMKGLEADLKLLGLNEGDDATPTDDEKAFLPKLFELSGTVKIPVVVSQLKRWLNENEGEKIIVFAHHHSVLNGIESSLEGLVGMIRIDGKTLPKKRQERVVSFQNDPRIRVAVLSTTAAGVGITLTASATVWFAEMYWTPGLLIQAEDRSHRIGQRKDVNVLYYVARDTLDEVLWKLAVRKFVAVGEMVDGSTSTLGVNRKGDAALLDVELELGNTLKDKKGAANDDDSAAGEEDDDEASAGWGRVADALPTSEDENELIDTDVDSSASTEENSFDSGCLTDDDKIEDDDSDSDSDDEVEIVEPEPEPEPDEESDSDSDSNSDSDSDSDSDEEEDFIRRA